MCGICAYLGSDAVVTVVSSLKKLEYRGYDSCGVALVEDEKICVKKAVGEVKNLQKITENLHSDIAIGHTRWATHGAVTLENSHPQISQSGELAIVHNGIVENFEALRKEFLGDVAFKSQTDTEVLVNLVERQNGNLLEKMISACGLVCGSFAIALLHAKEKKLYLAKRGSPLFLALENGTCMAGSDISVFAGKFEKCFALDDNEFAVLDAKNMEIFDENGKKIEKKPIFLNFEDFCEENESQKSFMLGEIEEQPNILRWTFFKFFNEKFFDQQKLAQIEKFKSFHFVACGTALHAAMLGAKYLRQLCGKNANVSYASEFRYDDNVFGKSTLYVFVSQSGETADTLACAKLVQKKGLSSMCVTNVAHCSLERICNFVLPTFAGREIAVASTKAYTAQIFSMLCFAIQLSGKFEHASRLREFVENVKTQKFDEKMAQKALKFEKIFFIGRNQDQITALEAALKLKEISYVNCLALPAGELKHGTLALVDDKTLVVAISTVRALKSKLESNVIEVKSRGGKVLLLSQFETDVDVDFFFRLDEFDELVMPIVSIFPLQRLAYDCCKLLSNNPDKPRNLAKSVTVE